MTSHSSLSIGTAFFLLTAVSAGLAETGKTTMNASSSGLNMDYIGDRSRVGLGVNTDGDVSGELLHVFGEDADSAWIGEGWVNSESAGGLKLDYHWVNQGGDAINKVFVAVDQNGERDRKLTLGGGVERENIFFEGYLSRALTDERRVASRSESSAQILTGADAIGDFQQTLTTTLVTDTYEAAYDYGVGLQVGRFLEPDLLRLRGGVDYEWGDYNSDLLTFSLGLEKYIAGTGHSFALGVQALNRSGDFEQEEDDLRGSLVWRYSFGESYRPRHVAVTTDEAPSHESQETHTPPEPEYRIVKNQVEMRTDTFFDKDSARLREESKTELKHIAGIIERKQIAGKISVVGHTCNLGSDDHNMTLSRQRAQSVFEQLVAYGVPGEMILTEGRGESQPRYSNASEAERQKNRRVDIHFLAVEETREALPMPAPVKQVEWQQETLEQQPVAWLQRALVSPVRHKREVDVYRFEKTSVSTDLTDPQYTNRYPVAANDQFQAVRNGGAVLIDVLANDSDPDNEELTIQSVTQPAGGVVENFGNVLSFTPLAGFSGATQFNYTLRDAQGAETEASVTVDVINTAPLASADFGSTSQGVAITLDVLSNDSDANGDAIEILSVDQPGNGMAQIENGMIRYQPDPGFTGQDSFNYTVSDAGGATANASVTVDVSEIPNQAPVARNDRAVSFLMAQITVDVLANDYDPDGDELTVIAIDGLPSPDIGIFTINEDSTITLTPTGWNGKTQLIIRYTISDGHGNTASANLSIIDP